MDQVDSVTTCDYIIAVKERERNRKPNGPAAVRESGAVYTVRAAKARFSELIRLAEQGTHVTITVHGRPKVCVTKAAHEGRPFRVARRWLETMKVGKRQTPAEQIIREDRDARG